MVGNNGQSSNETALQELSIEKACEEYNNSVKLTLNLINRQLDDALTKNCNGLDELAVKIAARTNFLEKNPSFLSCLVYNRKNVKCESLLEFDDVKITLKEHTRRIQEKLDEIERYHKKLFDLVMLNGREKRVVEEVAKMKTNPKDEDDDFHDALDLDTPKEEKDLFPITTGSKNSFDKVTIQKNAYSDISVSSEPNEPPVKFQIFPDIPADVQRRKPQEDLHGKLIQQLVATDSLEGFLKLMDRKPSVKRKVRRRTSVELEQKYTGSLWFFPSKPIKGKAKLESSKTSQISQKSKNFSTVSTCCNLLVTSSQPCPMTNQDRTRKIRQSLNRTKLKCYDLLDDLDHSDLKPIQSEYPRRDNIYPMHLQEAKSYLHRMMQENEKVWKKLLQPVEIKRKPQHLSAKKRLQPKAKHVKNLIEYLTAPEQKYLSHIPQSLIVMPVKIIYDNFPTKETTETPRGAVLITDLTKTCEPKKIEGKFLQTKTDSPRIDHCRSSPFPVQKKKAMLDQLRGLKLRNDNIQKNIQKAIDVIETKMIDLLSSPADANSSEAFTAMEKEITTVLKMMSETEQKERQKDEEEKHEHEPAPKEDQNEAEKDENNKVIFTTKVTIPKMKRELTTVKKSMTVDLNLERGDVSQELIRKRDTSVDGRKEEGDKISKKHEKRSAEDESEKLRKRIEEEPDRWVKKHEHKKNVDDEVVKKHKDDSKRREERKERLKMDERVTKKIKENKSKRRERSTDRVRVIKAVNEEMKKAANIEEGERLLGQVDNVIKKIDSIYTRFYDEGKTRMTPRQDANFSSVIEFFDGLKRITEPPPVIVEQGINYEIAEVYQEPSFYFRAVSYLPTITIYPPPPPPPPEVEAPPLEKDPPVEIEAAPVETEAEPLETEAPPEPEVPAPEPEVLPVEPEVPPCELEVPPPQIEIPILAEEFVADFIEIEDIPAMICTPFRSPINLSTNDEEPRHEYTLKAFYTFFFSSIFMALNLDYAS